MALNHKDQRFNRLVLVIYLLINAVLIRDAYLGDVDWYWIPLTALPLLFLIISFINQKIMDNNLVNPVVLPESDVRILKKLAAGQPTEGDDVSLAHEVERAIVVKDNAFPQNTIRINSHVKIQDLDTGEVSTLSLVLPEHADIRQKKISILAPIGAALIGFREGDLVSWKMPSGLRRFKVLGVHNAAMT